MHCLGVEFGEVTEGRGDSTFKQIPAALVIWSRAHGKGSWAQFQREKSPSPELRVHSALPFMAQEAQWLVNYWGEGRKFKASVVGGRARESLPLSVSWVLATRFCRYFPGLGTAAGPMAIC